MTKPPRPNRTRILSTRLTEVDEFVAELSADRELVERGIVRVTTLARPIMDGALTRIWVHAGAIIDGRPVVLERHVGELWGGDHDAAVHARAAAIAAALDTAIRKLGLQPRAGQLQEITA